MNEKVIEVFGISKSFKGKKNNIDAVDNISFSINKGECLGIIGESGSGKSTAAQMIAGFVKADSGEIFFKNKKIDLCKKDFKSRYGIQMIFQNPESSLNPKMKVRKILSEAALYLSDMNERERMQRAVQVLKLVHLPEEYLDKYPYELSGGECQRVAIARALVLKPQLLICDEVTSALDASVKAQIMRILSELKTNEKISILFITHDLALVDLICDTIAVMHKGRIIEIDKTDRILNNPTQEYTKQLLNSVITVD